jgi:hypothetical protein
MKQIICLSETKWSNNPERTQRLLTLLDEDVKVLFFELTVTENPLHSWKQRGSEHLREVEAGISVCHAPLVCYQKGHPDRMSVRSSIRRIAKYINQRVTECGFEHAIIWTDTPLSSALLEYIPHQYLIYDCYRSWDRYPVKLESDLAYRADLVFAASPNLFDHVSPCNNSVFLLENGVDCSGFESQMQAVEADASIACLSRPIFTYLGDISKSVQLEPLLFTAGQHQEWTFVIVGRVSNRNPHYKDLKDFDNIRCIGYHPHSSYPACLMASDVCFDLLHNDITDEDVVSERIYCYLASGLPIAAMYPARNDPEFPDVIYSAQNEADFEYACLCASSEGDRSKPELRRNYAAQADWAVRGETLRSVLDTSGLMM